MTSFYTNVFQRGGKIYSRGFDLGLRTKNVEPYKPYIFLPSKNKDTKYHTLDGKPVVKHEFDSISDSFDFFKLYKDVENFDYYGLTNWPYLFIYDNYPGKIKYDASLISVVGIDIETSLYNHNGVKKFPNMQTADHEITAITITKNNRSATFGCGEYVPENKKQFYVKCTDEKDLLDKFLKVWESEMWMPDIVTGWNIESFDMVYISNRIIRLFSKDMLKRLSPWKMIEEKTVNIKGEDIIYYSPMGISMLDYMVLYKKFTFTPRESFSLNFIASEELNEKKLDYSEFANLEELYLNNYQKFISYNIRDCFLVDRLEDKLKLIKMVINLAFTYKCNFSDTLGTVKPWDIFIHHYLLDRNIVIPQFKKNESNRELVGGYCKEVNPGLYEWVCSYDVKSSYPHQIMTYNISPETFIGKLNDITDIDRIIKDRLVEFKDDIDNNNLSVAGNLCVFRKDKKGFMPEIMEMMFAERAEYQKNLEHYEKLKAEEKTNKYDNLISEYDVWQLAKKISINAFYGMLANEWCRWYSIDLAEAITLSGQLTVKWIEYKINLYINKLCQTENVDYVCAGDTDSNYIILKPLLVRFGLDLNDKKKCVNFIQEFCKHKLDPYIKKSFEELHHITNSYQQKITMARENIANRAIWTAKKHYVLNVLNSKSKDYEVPKLKVVGLEVVKSSTPAVCRTALKDSLNIIMNKDQETLIEYIDTFKAKFNTLPIEDIAFPRGVNGINKYKGTDTLYIKHTPINVKGALVFNSLIKKYDIKNITPISDGDKIKYVYLKLPNKTRENTIAMPNYLPKEFGLENFVDRDLQFVKSFLDPLKGITNVIDWKTEDTITLESMFA